MLRSFVSHTGGVSTARAAGGPLIRAIPHVETVEGDRGVSRAARDYYFSSCLPVRNLRRYFLGRSIRASMIGPAERYGNCDERKLHLDFVIVLPTAKTGFLFVGDRPYPVVRFSDETTAHH